MIKSKRKNGKVLLQINNKNTEVKEGEKVKTDLPIETLKYQLHSTVCRRFPVAYSTGRASFFEEILGSISKRDLWVGARGRLVAFSVLTEGEVEEDGGEKVDEGDLAEEDPAAAAVAAAVVAVWVLAEGEEEEADPRGDLNGREAVVPRSGDETIGWCWVFSGVGVAACVPFGGRAGAVERAGVMSGASITIFTSLSSWGFVVGETEEDGEERKGEAAEGVTEAAVAAVEETPSFIWFDGSQTAEADTREDERDDGGGEEVIVVVESTLCSEGDIVDDSGKAVEVISILGDDLIRPWDDNVELEESAVWTFVGELELVKESAAEDVCFLFTTRKCSVTLINS